MVQGKVEYDRAGYGRVRYPIFYFTIGYDKVEYSSHRVWWGKEEKSKFKL